MLDENPRQDYNKAMSTLFYEKERDILGLYIEEAENTHCLQHFHNSLEMLYMLRGTFRITIDGKTYYPKEHELIYIPPLSSHVISDADSRSITLTIPQHLLSMYSQIVHKKSFATILSDVEYNERVILPLFRKLLSNHTTPNPFDPYSVIYSLFAEIYNRYPLLDVNTEKDAQLVCDIIGYLNENFKQEITLESLAKKFHYSKFYFSKLFDKYFHCTLKYYLNTLRVNYVAENLSTSHLPLATLIYEAGFTSSSTFYRHFKLIYNSSPKKINK